MKFFFDNYIVKALLFLLVFVSFFGLYKYLKIKERDEFIAKEISVLSKTLPQNIDSTRADSAIYLGDLKLKYVITFLSIEDNSQKQYLKTLKFNLKNKNKNFYKNDDSMKLFRENKFSITYVYKDKKGNYLFDFTVNPK